MEETLYLAHHGVKGQKWGVRRYQNPDGTLTAKGKAALEKYKKKQIRNIYSEQNDSDKKYNEYKLQYEKDLKGRDEYKRMIAEYKKQYIESERIFSKALASIEKSKIMHMKYDDMVNEKKYVAGNAMKWTSIGLGIAGGVAGSIIAVNPIPGAIGVTSSLIGAGVNISGHRSNNQKHPKSSNYFVKDGVNPNRVHEHNYRFKDVPVSYLNDLRNEITKRTTKRLNAEQMYS